MKLKDEKNVKKEIFKKIKQKNQMMKIQMIKIQMIKI